MPGSGFPVGRNDLDIPWPERTQPEALVVFALTRRQKRVFGRRPKFHAHSWSTIRIDDAAADEQTIGDGKDDLLFSFT
jgi:hypothetical protein